MSVDWKDEKNGKIMDRSGAWGKSVEMIVAQKPEIMLYNTVVYLSAIIKIKLNWPMASSCIPLIAIG